MQRLKRLRRQTRQHRETQRYREYARECVDPNVDRSRAEIARANRPWSGQLAKDEVDNGGHDADDGPNDQGSDQGRLELHLESGRVERERRYGEGNRGAESEREAAEHTRASDRDNQGDERPQDVGDLLRGLALSGSVMGWRGAPGVAGSRGDEGTDGPADFDVRSVLHDRVLRHCCSVYTGYGNVLALHP